MQTSVLYIPNIGVEFFAFYTTAVKKIHISRIVLVTATSVSFVNHGKFQLTEDGSISYRVCVYGKNDYTSIQVSLKKHVVIIIHTYNRILHSHIYGIHTHALAHTHTNMYTYSYSLSCLHLCYIKWQANFYKENYIKEFI